MTTIDLLKDVSKMTRDDVVPYYRNLIVNNAPDHEVVRVNKLILSKWTSSGLIYIKEKAWKGIDISNTFDS